MKNTGFTLVELMITVAVMAIFVVIAFPSYQNSVRKARRADAQAEMIEFAGTAERIFNTTTPNSYATATEPDDTTFYNYSLPVSTATTYTVTAAPIGVQSEDGCGTMTLTHTGVKTHTGSQTGCWD